MKKIVFIGGGGHARVLLDIVKENDFGDILGFVDLEKADFSEEYLGNDEDLKQKYSSEEVVLVNGVGSIKRPEKRREIFEKFKVLNYEFLSIIHPRATISKTVKLGEGVQAMANSVVNHGANIEDNVIINTSASIDHDCKIGAHSHIAPGVTLSGNVNVGKGCHIGTGVNIIQGITIGNNVLIAAGETITSNIEEGKTVFSMSK